MAKIAIITDIHTNLHALELVLKDIKENTLLDELSRFTDKLMNLDRSSFTDFQKRELCYDIEIAIGWFNALIDNGLIV